MTERDLLNELRMLASQHGARLFRNNVAQGWVGKVIEHRGGYLTLEGPRILHAGLTVGSSDLIGWDARGRFLAVEAKTGRVPVTIEQADFLDAVARAGGVAVLARSVDDLMRKLAP